MPFRYPRLQKPPHHPPDVQRFHRPLWQLKRWNSHHGITVPREWQPTVPRHHRSFRVPLHLRVPPHWASPISQRLKLRGQIRYPQIQHSQIQRPIHHWSPPARIPFRIQSNPHQRQSFPRTPRLDSVRHQPSAAPQTRPLHGIPLHPLPTPYPLTSPPSIHRHFHFR